MGRTTTAEAVLTTLVDIGALVLAGTLAMKIVMKLEVGGRRPTAGQSEKAKALAAKLKGKGNSSVSLKLREHELEVSSDVVAPEAITVSFKDVGGLQKIGEQLQRNIILPFSRPEIFKQSKLLRPPKGILLHGPPGTGKTLLAKAVAAEAKFSFICLNPARLLSKWYGESNKFADAYFSLAHKLAPSILFIDEIDCIFRTRGRGGAGAGGHAEHEATSMLKAQFLSLWDGLLSPSAPQVVVIAATNSPDDVDAAVLRRLPLSFEVPLPDVEGRADVLRLLLRDEPLAAEIDVRELARATEGYSGSDLDQLCKSAAMRSLEEYLEAEKVLETAAAEVAAAAAVDGGGEAAASSGRGAREAQLGKSSDGAQVPPPLSTGAIVRAEAISADTTGAPVVQVLDIRPLHGETIRYRLLISDGTRVMQALLVPQLNSIVSDEQVRPNSVVQLHEFGVHLVQNRKVAVLRDVAMLLHVDHVIGNPLKEDGVPFLPPNGQPQQERPAQGAGKRGALAAKAEAPATATATATVLRALTLDDFLQARAVVRPTRGRFAGVHHDVHAAPPPPPADLDDELYN